MVKSLTNDKGLIFDIQRYSIHDGPGIRTVVFFKGCPLRCQWCANPESLNPCSETGYSCKECISCGKCVDACKNDAITITENDISIDRKKCKKCFGCVESCPTGALRLFGKWYTVDETLDIVLKDEAFYKNSGGGVTLSGGEVLSQSEFASKFLKKAKEHGINTAIETSGFAGWDRLESVLRYTDLVLYDLKHVSEDMHIKYTGADNRLILENLKNTLSRDKKVIVRIPMIPGVNMDPETIDDYIKLLADLRIIEVNLLPFHQLGQSKYSMIGMDYTFKDIKPPLFEDVEAVANRMKEQGINVKVGG